MVKLKFPDGSTAIMKRLNPSQIRWASRPYNKNPVLKVQVRWFDVDPETGECVFQFWVDEKDPVENIRFLTNINPERWP